MIRILALKMLLRGYLQYKRICTVFYVAELDSRHAKTTSMLYEYEYIMNCTVVDRRESDTAMTYGTNVAHTKERGDDILPRPL